MSILKKIIMVFFSCMIIVSFTACKKEGPAERAGKKVDETVEKAGEKIKESAEKAGDKIEKAGEKVKEATKK
jgi:hyperosmotically inducible periplasmic protein